jgi:hypothetical protein
MYYLLLIRKAAKGRPYALDGRNRKYITNFHGYLTGRPRLRWEDNIAMDVR